FAPADSALGYADAKKSAFPIKAPPLAAPVQTPDLTFWAQGVGAWGKIDSDGNAADVSRNLAGFFTGFDRRFGEWRLGAAAGYTNPSLSVSARASSANIDTAYLAAYAGTGFGAWNFLRLEHDRHQPFDRLPRLRRAGERALRRRRKPGVRRAW